MKLRGSFGRHWVLGAGVAFGLLVASCSSDDLSPLTDAAVTTTLATAGSERHNDFEDADPCATDDLQLVHVGVDGAGGRSINLFALTTDGDTCRLSEPTSAVVLGRGVDVPRGLFVPARPFGLMLDPGERAVIGVETSSCDVDNGPHGQGIEVRFADGHTRALPLDLEGCNLRWDGLFLWE